MSQQKDDETRQQSGGITPLDNLVNPLFGDEQINTGEQPADESAVGEETDRFDAVVEAILFASGEPLTLERIASIVERPVAEVKVLLDNMGKRLRNARRGLLLRELSGKYQLCTRPELSVYVNKLFEIRQKHSLSQAAYETLSIVAYNANVTRAAIEKIRGVNSDSSIAKLLERGLIIETGRANLPGRPMRYDLTDEFYRLFGFNSRMDLPDIDGNDPQEDSGGAREDNSDMEFSV